MIIDSSAVVAVLLEEDGHETLEAKMRDADLVEIAAPVLFETEMVMVSALGDRGLEYLAELREGLGVKVTSFDEGQSKRALEAFVRFGKGRHPAALNYGDCMTYALASEAGRPLLFKGDDFARTDLEAA